MKFKYVLSFAFFISLFGGSLVANAQTNLVLGKMPFYHSNGTAPTDYYTGKSYAPFTDGDLNTTVNFYTNKYNYEPIVYDLGEDNLSISSFDFKADRMVSDNNLDVYYYDKDFKEIKRYTGKNSMNEKIAGVRYVGTRYWGFAPWSVREFEVWGSSNKVTDVANLKATPDVNKVSLSWENSDSTMFAGVNIYKDESLVATLDKNATSYVASNLKENTNYTFKVQSFDTNGAKLPGVSKTVTTLMPVLNPPVVSVIAQNKSLIITWTNINSLYLQGYNVYVDGQKVNSSLIAGNKLNLKNLENGKTYKIQVSAVNKNDLEGQKSLEAAGTPSASAMEIEYDVKSPFSVMDLLQISSGFLILFGSFLLLSLAILYFEPLKRLVVKIINDKKEKKNKEK